MLLYIVAQSQPRVIKLYIMEVKLPEIRKSEVLRYLGYNGQDLGSALEEQLQRCIDAVASSARPRLTYRIFDVRNSEIEGLSLKGNEIRELLKSSKQAIIMAATLGAEAEALLRRTEVTDISDAVIMDSAQSVAIESVCDAFEAKMRIFYREENLYLTDRYSPGYGDLPLNSQKLLMDVLQTEKRIGLAATASNMMVPRKSVTCIIGISDRAQKLQRSGCSTCMMAEKCTYRKQGRVCNGQNDT